MKTLFEYTTGEMHIVQPSMWKRQYELRTADTVLMTLSYPRLFSTRALIEGFGETWEVSKPSIWKSNLEIRRKGNELPFAKFSAEKWGRGGVFELPRGERIVYTFGMWKGTNELFSQNKIRLISLHRTSIWKSAVTVAYEKQSERIDENPWVIMAVYYVILERRSHASGASV